MRSANFSDTWVDIIVPGSGYDLRVRRTYSSRSLFNGMFGFGWCSDFETKIEITAENNLLLTECGGGAEITYSLSASSGTDVSTTIEKIVAEVGKRNKKLTKKDLNRLREDLRKDQFLRMALARKLDMSGKVEQGKVYRANGIGAETIVFKNNSYVRTLEDGTYQFFDKNGRLVKMQDSNRNYLALSYSGDKLTRVLDNNGRQLNFVYKKGTGKVAQITAPGKLKASYAFKGENLSQVVNQWKTKYGYEYDNLHNLTKIAFQDGTTKEIAYNQKRDWVVKFKNRKGCVEDYQYKIKNDDHYWSNVIKKCGNKVTNRSTYEFIYKRKPGSNDKYLYEARSEVNGEKSEVIYHPDFGKPVKLVRNGVQTLYSYYDNGFVKAKKEFVKMGSYGIGVSRLVGAIIEAKYNDKDEIMKWPISVSPYDCAIIPMIKKNDTTNLEKCNKIFEYFKSKNIDAIIDDTDENISAKIKKFNLIGIPYQLIIGNKTEGDLLEFKEINGETQKLKIEEVASQIQKAKSN